MTKKDGSVLLSALDNYGGYPFNEIYDEVFPVYGQGDVKAAADLFSVVALVIWGGGDISPAIYGQKSGRWNGAGDELSRRDRLEVECAEQALELGIPIIGICRGAQLMCALSGGTLVQHVTGHAGGWHPIVTDDGRKFDCPSLHHQMMYPWPSGKRGVSEWTSIAWTEPARSKVYFGEPTEENPEKPTVLTLHGPEQEIIYIPATKSLCIQSHPEFIHEQKHPFVDYCNELAKKYCHFPFKEPQ